MKRYRLWLFLLIPLLVAGCTGCSEEVIKKVAHDAAIRQLSENHKKLHDAAILQLSETYKKLNVTVENLKKSHEKIQVLELENQELKNKISRRLDNANELFRR